MVDHANRFHYPPADEYTGLVQYCIDRMGIVDISSGDRKYGTVSRGEVFKAKEGLARKLVTKGSDFTHVAAGTQEGQPEEYKLQPKPAAPSSADLTEGEES